MRQKLLLAMLGTAMAQSAVAQDGGTKFVFGLNSGLRASDNWTMVPDPEDTSLQFNNALSFGIFSETRASRVAIELGADLHHTDIASSPAVTALSNPSARASFSRSGPSSSLALSAGVSQADQEIVFSDSTGTKTTSSLGATYAFGTGQKFGGSVSTSLSESNYTDSSDDDTKTTSISGSLHFQASPNLVIRPNFATSRYEKDDGAGSVTKTDSFGVGVAAQIDEVSTVEVDINQKEIDNSGTVTDGITGRVAYVRSVPNGTHTIAISSDVSNDGPRTELNYNRVIQSAQTTSSYGIGVSESADGANVWTANFDISRPMQRGSLSANLARSFSNDEDGNEVLTTSLGAKVSRDLSETSGIDLSLSLKAVEETSDTDSTDGQITLSYRRTVAENWNLTAGIEHKYSDDDASDPIRGNTVFVTFARTWESFR